MPPANGAATPISVTSRRLNSWGGSIRVPPSGWGREERPARRSHRYSLNLFIPGKLTADSAKQHKHTLLPWLLFTHTSFHEILT